MSCKFSNEKKICILFLDDHIKRPTFKDGTCFCEYDLHPEKLCDDYEER